VVAIMECFFPAQATGEAIRMVLTNSGNNSNPGGRLPFTWLMYDYQVCIFLFFFLSTDGKIKIIII
jgi:beta-glucosidase